MQYITLHPYQYTYFNGIVGGLVGAQNNFETDYWGASYKEAVLWLVANKRNEDASVGICGNQPAITYFSTTNFNPIWMPNCEQDENTNTRYVITNNRNAEWERVRGQEIFAVTRFGVPLTKVFETN